MRQPEVALGPGSEPSTGKGAGSHPVSPACTMTRVERDGWPAQRMRTVRWWLWAILATCYLMVYFQRIAPGVVADRLMADFAVGGAAVGLLTSIYFYLYAAMQVPSGVLADSLGVRYTAAIGIFLAGIGSMVFGLAPGLEWAYLGRFLVGLGVSVVFVTVLKFQSNWFLDREFGTISGLLMLVGNLGAVTATTPVAAMAQLMGWRLSFLVIGLVTCAVGVATWWWVRDRPSDMGLPSPNGLAAEAASVDSRSIRTTRGGLLHDIATVWGSSQTWAGFLAHFGLLGSYLTFNGLWAVPYLMHVYDMDRVQAANYLLAASLGMVVSAPLLGHISDRSLLSRRQPIMAMGVLACGVWLAFTLWDGGRPPLWALYPLFVAMGFAGGTVGLILTSVKEANPPDLSGLATGTANSGFLCAAILQPVVGWLLDSRWHGQMADGARVYPVEGYQAMLVLLTCVAVMGLAGAWRMRETHQARLAVRVQEQQR